MKRLVVVLSSLLVLPAFAEVAPQYYDAETVFSDVELDDVDTGEVETVASEKTDVVKPQSSVAGARSTDARANQARTSRTTSSRANTLRSRNISNRGGVTPIRTSSVSTRRAVTPIGTPARTGTTARVSMVANAAPLYNPNTVQSRTSTRSFVTTRGAAIRAATPAATTAEEAVNTTTNMDTMKALTEYCQAQYASCMDNYCNVLDDNQGRCTCSKNVTNYEKTEAALANATEALQDVARNIQYIGLSADQITTLFTETEAELTMKEAKDSSAIRSSLDKIKRMIVDVKSGTASATETNTMTFDLSGLLNFDLETAGFDFTSFMNTTTGTNSISNQRGESLYKTAASRCKASVLNSCTSQGVDAAVVTNAYDLEIDKSCLAYERALIDANTNMSQTVANAKEVLKKARLMVAQNKNSYDLRGCVSALESCMQDDYVCGNDYENCLDPTGQFIVNGAVVIGSMPGNNTGTTTSTNQTIDNSTYSHKNLFATWNISATDLRNPWYTDNGYAQEGASSSSSSSSSSSNGQSHIALVDYIEQTVKDGAAKAASERMSAFLQNKIGWHDDKENKDYGMCMSVLNKCQDYTYTNKRGQKYNAENEVIKQFMQRALVTIKMAQDELLASYAENCISDVSGCLSSNGYDSSNPEGTKSRTAINACYAQIRTCLSVNGNIFGSITNSALQSWVTGNYGNLEIVDSLAQVTAVCAQYSSQADCENNIRMYCMPASGSGNTPSIVSNACVWSAGSNSTSGNCVPNNNSNTGSPSLNTSGCGGSSSSSSN